MWLGVQMIIFLLSSNFFAQSLKSVLVPLLQILGDFGHPTGTAPDQGISEPGHFRTARTYCFIVICSNNLSQWEGERCQNPLWEFVWTKNHIEQGSRSEAWFLVLKTFKKLSSERVQQVPIYWRIIPFDTKNSFRTSAERVHSAPIYW